MKKKICLLLCLSLILLSACGRQSDNIRFGAADIGGMYYAFASSFSGAVSKDTSDYKFEVKNTAGSAANLRLLSDKYIDLGIAQADLIKDAYEGTGYFKDNVCNGYKAVAALYTEACQIVVKANSDIKTIDDLQGKKICIGAEESGTEINAKQILEFSGLNSKLVDMVNLDYTDAAKQLAEGKIDAFFCTAGIQTTVISELTKECSIRILNIDDKCLKKLLAAYTCYSKYQIPANTYAGQTESVTTIGVKSVLLASDNLSENAVKQLTKTLFTHTRDLQYATSLELVNDEKTAVEGIDIPFHSGAAAYYKEKGITVKTS
ncbi:TAXI family TRAP transporter solute-binding subunit [Eubacterium sp. MSJ-13]|uniref:TAXI family TRAP transporter solute-binding subunit n=1 Tax=Eubacterium sp. MSJ-13 TaxID=2841513 RepID=UPI001C1091BC|nr:TAXI family TRAP transporter solute-binding subunit [Eubacterium sp. MSJ-13]MBU5478134.1 TAXI family TRAP transporter solute-binding subunit [Eubacterium sp. MSJ-13]